MSSHPVRSPSPDNDNHYYPPPKAKKITKKQARLDYLEAVHMWRLQRNQEELEHSQLKHVQLEKQPEQPQWHSISAVSSEFSVSSNTVCNRSSTKRAETRRDGMRELSLGIRASLRQSETVSGDCCIEKCNKISVYRSALFSEKYCRKHGLNLAKERDDIITSLGYPAIGKRMKAGQILFIYSTHWLFKEKPDTLKEFIPATPKRYTVCFHRELMNKSYDLACDGIPMNKIWRNAVKSLPCRPPRDCYKQFSNCLVEFVSWKTLERNLIFDQTPKHRDDLKFGFSCPCCFGDKTTSKTIILVIYIVAYIILIL